MTTATTLRRALLAERLTQGRNQYDIAAKTGVSQPTVSIWEKGIRVPRAHHAVAWAAALQHRLTVTHGGATVGDLQDLLGNLASLRRAQGHSGAEIARRLNLLRVYTIENHAVRGRHLDFVTVDRYLQALGYRVEIHPSEVNSC